jgi:hypothetical protein
MLIQLKINHRILLFLFLTFTTINLLVQIRLKFSMNLKKNLDPENRKTKLIQTKMTVLSNKSTEIHLFDIKKDEKNNSTNRNILKNEFKQSFKITDKKSNSESNFIFIGGYARSGTTLMVYILLCIFLTF